MSTEYGIFNDEGMIEGDFYSIEEAQKAISARYADEDDVHVAQVCHDHRDQPKDGCEECAAEEEAEEAAAEEAEEEEDDDDDS